MIKLTPRFGWEGTLSTEKESKELLLSEGVGFIDPSMIDFDEQIARHNQLLQGPFFGTASSSVNVYKSWELEERLLGARLPCVPQPEGDCVAASTERALERLLVSHNLMHGMRRRFRHVYRPYIYGIGRVIYGKNRIRGCGGSLITWQMAAIMDKEWGILQEGLDNLPKYSQGSACDFGRNKSTLDKWKPLASGVYAEAFEITSLDTFVKTLQAGYAVCVASMRGFKMALKHDPSLKKSWFVASGEWPHQMSFDAIDLDCSVPCSKVDNQWGDNAHPGQLDGPSTGGWVPLEGNHTWTIAKWLKSGEFWGIRLFSGWPDPSMIDVSMI